MNLFIQQLVFSLSKISSLRILPCQQPLFSLPLSLSTPLLSLIYTNHAQTPFSLPLRHPLLRRFSRTEPPGRILSPDLQIRKPRRRYHHLDYTWIPHSDDDGNDRISISNAREAIYEHEHDHCGGQRAREAASGHSPDHVSKKEEEKQEEEAQKSD